MANQHDPEVEQAARMLADLPACLRKLFVWLIEKWSKNA